MKTVLITGSNGFTGRYVAAVFRERGYKVVGMVHGEAGEHEVQCDLTDIDSLCDVLGDIKPNGIINLAALSFVEEDNPLLFYEVNVIGALNLLDATEKIKLNVDKFIFSSSANVYGNPAFPLVDEDVPLAPINHYAVSKVAMEFMLRTYFDKYPIIITRPFNYTGPGQDIKFLVPKIVEHYKQRAKTIELGNLNVARDFSDVRDVADAYYDLYESNIYSEIFNIASGNVFELKEIIHMMNELSGYEMNVKVSSRFTRKNEIKILRGDNTKLKKLIDYKQSRDFLDTLRDMYFGI